MNECGRHTHAMEERSLGISKISKESKKKWKIKQKENHAEERWMTVRKHDMKLAVEGT